MIIKNGIVVQNNNSFISDIKIDNGIISDIASNIDFNDESINAEGCYVVPGFIDIHTHGANNVDVNNATAKDFEKVASFFASRGTTSFQPSILTDTKEKTQQIIDEISKFKNSDYSGAKIVGIHLEGPFLSQEYKGSMPEKLIQEKFDLDLIEHYQKRAGGLIRYITVAPELEGVIDNIEKMNDLGIRVAIGHSSADYETSMQAIKKGALSATHTMNAMKLIHQHFPAITGAVLESDIYCEIICDGLHLHPATVRLILKTKGLNRVIAITDSIMAAGLSDGEYALGVNSITVKDGDAKVSGTNIRAGSTLTMDKALRNLIGFTGFKLEQIIPLLTENPANLLGLDSKGKILKGYDGDLVILSKDYEVLYTIVSGKVIYHR